MHFFGPKFANRDKKFTISPKKKFFFYSRNFVEEFLWNIFSQNLPKKIHRFLLIAPKMPNDFSWKDPILCIYCSKYVKNMQFFVQNGKICEFCSKIGKYVKKYVLCNHIKIRTLIMTQNNILNLNLGKEFAWKGITLYVSITNLIPPLKNNITCPP